MKPLFAPSFCCAVKSASYAFEDFAKRFPHPWKECPLGQLCSIGERRPLFCNGEQSHAIWDILRRLMNNGFRNVLKLHPAATVNYIWNEPVVVYYDYVLTNE